MPDRPVVTIGYPVPHRVAPYLTRNTAPRTCFCGRRASTLPDSDGVTCAEHD